METTEPRRQAWYRRPALIAVAGIAVSLAGFAFDRHEEWDLARLRFERDVQPLALAVQRSIDRPITALQSTAAILAREPAPAPGRFETIVGDAIARRPEIVGVAWVGSGAPSYRLGLDLGPESVRRSISERARVTGQPAAALAAAGGSQAASALLVAVPAGDSVLIATLRLDRLLTDALGEQNTAGIALAVVEAQSSGPDRVVLHVGASEARGEAMVDTPLHAADRRLALRVRSTTRAVGEGWPGWEVLLIGLGITTVAAAAAWASRRTAQLAVTTGHLEQAVTDSREISAALRDSEQRYRLMADNVHDVISVLDLDHTLLYVSPSVTRLRGYTVEEVLAQPVTERICAGSLGLVAQTVREALEAEAAGGPDEEHAIEIETPCKDGSTVWVETKASFLRDHAGRPTGILSVARDVTKRRRGEQRTKALAEASRVLARSLDPDEVGRIVATGACRLLGGPTAATYTLDAASGELVLTAVAPDGAEGWPARLRANETPPGIVLPLVARERRLGVLAVKDQAGQAFTNDDVDVARTFADQAAVVLENASLHQETERQLRHSETLLTVSQAISSSLDIAEVFRRTTRAVTRALGADAGATWRVHTDGARLTPLAGYHVPSSLVPPQAATALSLSHPLLRELGETVKPVWSADSQRDARFGGLPWLDALPHRSVLILPLRGTEGILGAVSIAWTARRHDLTSEERDLVEAIGRQIAVGIDNVRLVEELRSRQSRLEALLEVNRQLSTIQPLHTLLGRIAEGCGRVLDTTAAGFRLVDGEDLVLAGSWGDTKALMSQPRLKLGESLSGGVAATGRPIVSPDVAHEPRITVAGKRAAAAAGYHAWLGVPVRTGAGVIGVLTVWSRREGAFSAQDVATAEAFAGQAATALENARLYQEMTSAYDELSRTQAQLVQSQKMEAIGRLAGGIAHDFNNLLTIVSGRAQILNVKLADADPLQRHVELIKKTVERTAGVTRQLLAFSRHQVLKPQTLDLSDLVQHMGTMLRALIGEDVELTTELAPALGAVHVDPSQMEQVVMNLVVNARDAMPKGGRLTITTSDLMTAVSLTGAAGEVPPGAWTMLAVTDTGTGMAAETLTHIFEPFFTTKPAGQGTGLGLATVYGIVNQSGGHVLVDSRLGEGTTFRIVLPRVTPAAGDSDEVDERPAPRAAGAETILLVEDEDEVRELVSELLTGLGYRVLTAANGAEAVALCERHHGPIDLMVSDVIMPVMSGPEAAAHLHTLRPEMKVLYVSGYTDSTIAPHGTFELGVSLLLKPFDPAELARAVRRRLDSTAVATA